VFSGGLKGFRERGPISGGARDASEAQPLPDFKKGAGLGKQITCGDKIHEWGSVPQGGGPRKKWGILET